MNRIKLHLAGKVFDLTREDAAFIAEHLRAATVRPTTALSFSRRSDGNNGRILVERSLGSSDKRGDCALTDC